MDAEAKSEAKQAARNYLLCMLVIATVVVVGVVIFALYVPGNGQCLDAESLDDCETTLVLIPAEDPNEEGKILECCTLWEEEKCKNDGMEIPFNASIPMEDQYKCVADADSELACEWGQCG